MSKTQSLKFVRHPHPSPVAAEQARRAAEESGLRPGLLRPHGDHPLSRVPRAGTTRASSRARRSRWIRPQPSCTTRRKSSRGSRPIAPPMAARPCSGRGRMPGASSSRPSGSPCRSCPRRCSSRPSTSWSASTATGFRTATAASTCAPSCSPTRSSSASSRRPNYLFIVIASSVGAYFKTGAPAVSVWVSTDYTRAAPGGTGAAKCGGNYAASLLAQAEATRHGCDQVVFLDAVEQRWVEELGGMNIFFVFDDGSMVDAAAGRHDPARHHARRHCSRWPTTRASRFARTAIRSTNGAPMPPAAAFARPSPAARRPSSRRSARSASKDGEFKIGNGGPGTRTEELKAALVGIQRGRAADPHGWIHKVF